MRLSWKVVPIALVLVGVLGMMAAWRSTAAQTATVPLCTQSMANWSAAKAAYFQKVCARIAKDQQRPVAAGGYDPQPPPDLPTIPAGVPNGPTMGIDNTKFPYPPWLLHSDFIAKNVWWGPSNVVYAGSRKSDHSQGVFYLADRFKGPIPTEIGVFHPPNKDGALTITAAKGAVLTLTAADGAIYTFNVTTRALTP